MPGGMKGKPVGMGNLESNPKAESPRSPRPPPGTMSSRPANPGMTPAATAPTNMDEKSD